MAALARTESCTSRSAQVLMAGYEECAQDENELTPEERALVRQKVKLCTLLSDVNVPQCLTHMGAKAWVTIVTTMSVYISILPVAMALRPSLSTKCD